MNCEPCTKEQGQPVPMERVEHKNREVVGVKKRESGGWAYSRKTIKTFVHWYCPNSFAHTVIED